MVQFTPLGGANEIGGSCGVLEAFGLRLVIDAGVRPKARENKYPNFDWLASRGSVDAVLVTHAHADHTGALPILHRILPDVRVFATPATIRIARTLLRDSVSIQERDWEGEVDFTLEEVDSLVRAFVPVEFYTPTVVASTDTARVSVQFVPAGHILGAAMLAIEFEELEHGQIERVLVSGDISDFDQPTIPAMDTDSVRGFRPSLLICEGTYGTDVHDNMALEEARFVERVAQVLERGGKVLIPAFAVGRAQNVALILRDALENPRRYAKRLGKPDFKLPKAMVVIDGMCRTIMEEYTAFRHLLREPLQEGGEPHVFYDPNGIIRPVRNSAERHSLMRLPGPMVIISSSGMLTGGPSVGYAAAVAGDPQSAILLCGYQDEESPGRALARLTRKKEGDEYPVVTLGGERVEIRCEVDQYSLSAHSDAEGIQQLFEAVQPLHLALVHGTPTGLAKLQRKLEMRARDLGLQVFIEVAHGGETIEVDGSERFDEPVFPRTTGILPNWAQKVLTGRAAYGNSETSSSSAWVNASLLIGRGRALTSEEVARLDSLALTQHMLGPDEVAMVREAMRIGQGLLWVEQRVGPDQLYLPTLPGAVECRECGETFPETDPAVVPRRCGGCGSTQSFAAPRRLEAGLDQIIRVTGERYRVQRRMSQKEMAAHRERTIKLGVGVGDLVLFATGIQDSVRIVPAVLREEREDGYLAISPGATDPHVGYAQIVARVGPWPSPGGVGLTPVLAEVQLLDAIGRGVSALAIEYRSGAGGEAQAASGIQDRDKTLFSLWSRVPRGEISPLAASLASVILVSWHPSMIVQCTTADLVELLGGEGAVSAMMVVTALRELVERGLLQMRDVEGGLQLQWTPTAQQSLQASSSTLATFRELGTPFQRLLRDAFYRAVNEVRHLGVTARCQGYNSSVPSTMTGGGQVTIDNHRRLKKPGA